MYECVCRDDASFVNCGGFVMRVACYRILMASRKVFLISIFNNFLSIVFTDFSLKNSPNIFIFVKSHSINHLRLFE